MASHSLAEMYKLFIFKILQALDINLKACSTKYFKLDSAAFKAIGHPLVSQDNRFTPGSVHNPELYGRQVVAHA